MLQHPYFFVANDIRYFFDSTPLFKFVPVDLCSVLVVLLHVTVEIRLHHCQLCTIVYLTLVYSP